MHSQSDRGVDFRTIVKVSSDLARGGGYIPLFSGALSRLGSVDVFSAEFCGWRAAAQEKGQAFRKGSMLKPSYDLFLM